MGGKGGDAVAIGTGGLRVAGTAIGTGTPKVVIVVIVVIVVVVVVVGTLQ